RGAPGAAAIHVGLGAVFHAVAAARALAKAARANGVDAIRAGVALVADGTFRGAAPAAVDAGLVRVLNAVRARGRRAGARGANAALAVHGARAGLAHAAAGAQAAAIDVRLVLVLHAIGA